MAIALAKRISTTVEDDVHDRISAAVDALGVSRSDLLSALLDLWDKDPAVQERVAQPAQKHREETFRRQYLQRKPKQR